MSKLARSQLGVHLWVHSISASKSMSKLARSQPPSESLRSINLSLQLHFQPRSITASKSISKLARSRPPSASLSSSKCISEFTQSRPPSALPNSLDCGLRVYSWVHSILASKCISELTQSQHPSACLNMINLGLQVHPYWSTTGVRRYRGNRGGRSVNRHLQAHFELLTITVCCQSRYTMCR